MHLLYWLKSRKQKASPLLVLLIIAGVLGLRILGAFEPFELFLLDAFFKLRPSEATDPRIVVITIDETDLRQLARWPLTDRELAKVLDHVRSHQPRIIALDIYRDFSIQPGQEELLHIFSSTPNLLGIEQIGEIPVAPPPELAKRGQVGFANLPLDSDGKIRRAILSVKQGEQVSLGLGTFTALEYLKHDQIELKQTDPDKAELGTAMFRSLSPFSGGYGHFDHHGYQIMLNYRKPNQTFQRFSIMDALENSIPSHLIRDRVVFIGVTAPSLNDTFLTPYDISNLSITAHSAGVEIHAQITSQILSAVLDNRPLLNVLPRMVEVGFVVGFTVLGTWIVGIYLSPYQNLRSFVLGNIVMTLGLTVTVTLVLSYNAFLMGWWIPVATSLITLLVAVSLSATWHNQFLHHFAYLDGLTNIANRRCFDYYLSDQLLAQKPLCMILCDIDYFKRFNDRYGHQQGDECLVMVAQALQKAIRSSDFVARYGGEEFVVLLPHTNLEVARQIAERMREAVKALYIPHQSSSVSPFVSISCGVTCTTEFGQQSAKAFIEMADKVLYEAKMEGRDRVVTTTASSC